MLGSQSTSYSSSSTEKCFIEPILFFLKHGIEVSSYMYTKLIQQITNSIIQFREKRLCARYKVC